MSAKWRLVVIYARVSKADSAQTTAQQVEACRRLIGDRADRIEVVEERAGAGKARPQLDALMRRVRRREVDAVVVARFDRFARSCRELILALDEFNDLGVAFLSAHEGIDPTTGFGRAVFQILGAIAELEKRMISERTKEKLDHLRAKGVKLGRPCVEVDEARARRLVLGDGDKPGLSVRKLARALATSQGTAARLRRKILAGAARALLALLLPLVFFLFRSAA